MYIIWAKILSVKTWQIVLEYKNKSIFKFDTVAFLYTGCTGELEKENNKLYVPDIFVSWNLSRLFYSVIEMRLNNGILPEADFMIEIS